MKLHWQRLGSPSHLGWALLLLAVVIAGGFRLWQLGQLPPGLYRDEAFNGLDALKVLDGQHAWYFPANNGREPLYIYLTTFFISLFGRSALSVRLGAAVVGTLTTWITYQIATTWFNRKVGLVAAWLWAVTFWPVHLSRIGLRPILMPLFLTTAFWIGTLAYRRRKKLLWFLSGLIYGAGFYTYLAMRFTPLIVLILGGYLVLSGRFHKIRKAVLWFGLGVAIALVPLATSMLGQPELILGRSGQVSIFSISINGGDFWGTLWGNLAKGVGMFFWKGDTILRHNSAGRPVFDLFMAVPFVAGLIWCGYRWRRPQVVLLVVWSVVMLGPTVLAEDTPHFLRAAGLLPVVLLFPAIGLTSLWEWQPLPTYARQSMVVALLVASAMKTLVDYVDYGRQPDVAFLFEAAAADLSGQIIDEDDDTAVFVDERFWQGWPTIPFLVGSRPVTLFRPEAGLPPQPEPPVSIYAWPYGPLDYVPAALPLPSLISVEDGSLARGDLDETANPLYVRYAAQSRPLLDSPLASFNGPLRLWRASRSEASDGSLEVDLYWSSVTTLTEELVIFVHVTEVGGAIIAQDDAPVASGRWPRQWWQPDVLLIDRHAIDLPVPYNPERYSIQIGMYDVQTRVRVPIVNAAGDAVADSWLLED